MGSDLSWLILGRVLKVPITRPPEMTKFCDFDVARSGLWESVGTRCKIVVHTEMMEHQRQVVGRIEWADNKTRTPEDNAAYAAYCSSRAQDPGELRGKSCRHAGLAWQEMR